MLNSLEGKRVYFINEEYISGIKAEINTLEKKKKEGVLDNATFSAQMEGKSQILALCNGLKEFAEDNEITLDFVFLKTSQFNSGFGKADFSDITIVFEKNGVRTQKKFKDVVPTFNVSSIKKDYYYIYSKEADNISGSQKNVYQYMLEKL